MSKATEKPKLRDILQDTWPVQLKTFKIMKNNERLKSCHRPEKTADMTTKCNAVPWIVT